MTKCWSCHKTTRAVALVGSAGSIAFDDDFQPPETESVYDPVLLSSVARVSDDVAMRVRTEAPTFRIDASNTLQTEYWMNHCQHCGAKQGDYFLHTRPDGPFFGWSGRGATTTLVDLCGGDVQCDMPYLEPPPEQRKVRRSTT